MSDPATNEPDPAEGGEPSADELEDVVAAAEAALDTDGRTETETERERDEYLDALRRLQADFENYRKRVARDASDVAARAAADVVAKLLPALDALDLAQAHLGDAPGDEIESVAAKALVQARALLMDALEKEGLSRIADVDVPFDPTVHDAVAHVPADDDGQFVDDVLRAGYRYRGAVLRPAMVRVRG